MRAVLVSEPGGPEALALAYLPDLPPGPGEVVIHTAATAGVPA
jgi:NADPH:quinone reductase-like Zn-dependent oxidoreductase